MFYNVNAITTKTENFELLISTLNETITTRINLLHLGLPHYKRLITIGRGLSL